MKKYLWLLIFLLMASFAQAATYSHQYFNVNNLSEYDVIENHTDGTYRVIPSSDTYYITWCQSNTPAKISGNRFILVNAGTVSVDPNMSSILAAEAAAVQAAQAAQYQATVTALTPYLPTGGSPSWSSVTSKPTTLSGFGITDAVSSIDSRLSDSRNPLTHYHAWSALNSGVPTTLSGYGITDGVLSNDSRLSDARTPVAHNQTKATITDFTHTHAESEVTNLTTDLAAKQATLTRNTGLITYAALANGTTAMAFGTNSTVKVTPNATATFTTTVPAAGCSAYLIILTSGTSSYTITFGSGFKTTGTLATGTVTAKVFVLQFISDGTTLHQVSRTTAM